MTLARSTTRNAQTPATWRRLAAIGAELLGEEAVRVVVLRAEGPSFSAGLDRAMFTTGVDGEPSLVGLAGLADDELDGVIAEFQRAFTWWRDPRLVTVAAVQGHAVGAGFQLALACDIRILAGGAQLAMRETSLGLVPDLAGTGPLVEAVGYACALEICATGRWVGAEEAVAIGLASLAVPGGELDQTAQDLAAAVLSSPAGAVRATKALLQGARQRNPEDQRSAERAAQAGRLRALANNR